MSFCVEERTFWTNAGALEDYLRSEFLVGVSYSFARDQTAALGQLYVAFEVEPIEGNVFEAKHNLTGCMLNQLCYEGKIEAGVYVVENSKNVY